MGGRLAPPSDELFDPAYAKSPDRSDLWWRSIFENPTTVQFDHRCLVSGCNSSFQNTRADHCYSGYHHLYRNCRTVRIDVQPCAEGRPATVGEAHGDCRVRDGQRPSPPRNLYALVLGPDPACRRTPGRQCGVVDHHDPLAHRFAETRSGRKGLAAGAAEQQEERPLIAPVPSPRGLTCRAYNYHRCICFRSPSLRHNSFVVPHFACVRSESKMQEDVATVASFTRYCLDAGTLTRPSAHPRHPFQPAARPQVLGEVPVHSPRERPSGSCCPGRPG